MTRTGGDSGEENDDDDTNNNQADKARETTRYAKGDAIRPGLAIQVFFHLADSATRTSRLDGPRGARHDRTYSAWRPSGVLIPERHGS